MFKDPTLQLHTTRSWDFLEGKSGMQFSSLYPHASSDVIIGVIDTGNFLNSHYSSLKILMHFYRFLKKKKQKENLIH